VSRAISYASLPISEAALDVARGLRGPKKSLPAYLFYDAIGSGLYERITELPEYYPTRTERAILEAHAPEIAELIGAAKTVIELGAGTATKTEILLAALIARGSQEVFIPVDVSRPPLEEATARLAARLPSLEVKPVVATHERAFELIAEIPGRKAVLFIGSSIGNYDAGAATRLLRGIRESAGDDALLLLGTDRVKSADVLVPAYDDAQGVTAAFNKNVLARINRELGGHFDLTRFDHVALWNASESRIEMHLESNVDQAVRIEALDMTVHFNRGERIHTESSVKYDRPRVTAMLAAAGFERVQSFMDEREWFSVHLARAV